MRSSQKLVCRGLTDAARRQARSESYQALNFISLLVSQHNPSQAEKTIDPYIKNVASLGVLGTDSARNTAESDAQKDTDNLVAIGWKMQALDSVADSLLNSATRLEQEMEKETKYWEKALAVKEHGWSVSRMPQEKHILAVRYGFAEGNDGCNLPAVIQLTDLSLAHADYRDRGLAALRREEDGDISLVRGSRRSNRVLRVRIMQKEKILSSSAGGRLRATVHDNDIDDTPIERQILEARDSILDEELHSELHREAHNLTNQGISCVGDRIYIPYEADQQIEIDLVDLETEATNESHTDNVATAIGIALRVLLSHAHRQNLHRRSQPPPPVMDSKQSRLVYPILKPLIETIRHDSDAQAFDAYLLQLTTSLKQAGLSLIVNRSTTTHNIPSNISVSKAGEPPLTDTLLNALTSPLSTRISAELPSSETHFSVELYTSLIPPTLGTDFRTRITARSQGFFMDALPESMQFASCIEVQEYINQVLLLDLVSLIHTTENDWNVVNPYTGTLSRSSRNGPSANLRLYFKDKSLGLEWKTREQGQSVQHGSELWKAGDQIQRSFMDVVRDVTANLSS